MTEEYYYGIQVSEGTWFIKTNATSDVVEKAVKYADSKDNLDWWAEMHNYIIDNGYDAEDIETEYIFSNA